MRLPQSGRDTTGWAGLTDRIYADRDFSPGGREVALALAWAMSQDPVEGGHWRLACETLGRDGVYRRNWRIWEALSEDLPYYDPGGWSADGGECEGPRMRPYKPRRPDTSNQCLVSDHHPHIGDCRFTQISYWHLDGTIRDYPGPEHAQPERDDSICGARGTISVTEHDPVTGWETRHWFCPRHKERAREVKAQLRAALADPPPPIPNRGGVLPRYFVTDWERQYKFAAKKAYGKRPGISGWEPPYHGVCRDDWPVPGKTAIPRRPRLAIVS